MMKIIFIAISFLCSIPGFSQDSIVIGSKHKIYSGVLKEERNFWVYLPPDYNNSTYSPATYPVVYLLDAETNFHSFTGILQALSRGPYAMIPQMIVVGILNTDRTRDLTPTASGRQAFYDKNKTLFQNGGGNKNFIDFLSKELKRFVDSAYRTSGYNILNGHSFGGLTAVNILLNYTTLFNAYIIIDPSLWWDSQVMLKQAAEILPVKDFENRNIFLALAHKEIVRQDTTTDHPTSIMEFEKMLDQQKPKQLRRAFKFYENDDHGTVPIPAEFDGLKFIFKGHMVHVKQAIADPGIVSNQFAILSQQLGFNFQPTESYLNWMGNYCMGIDKTKQAIVFYKMATDIYPRSANSYISLGEAYTKNGDKNLSKQSFKKALELSPQNKKAAMLLQKQE